MIFWNKPIQKVTYIIFLSCHIDIYNLFLKIEKLFAVLSFAYLTKIVFFYRYIEIVANYRMCKTHKLIIKIIKIYLYAVPFSFVSVNKNLIFSDFLSATFFKRSWWILLSYFLPINNVSMIIWIFVFYFRLSPLYLMS